MWVKIRKRNVLANRLISLIHSIFILWCNYRKVELLNWVQNWVISARIVIRGPIPLNPCQTVSASKKRTHFSCNKRSAVRFLHVPVLLHWQGDSRKDPGPGKNRYARSFPVEIGSGIFPWMTLTSISHQSSNFTVIPTDKSYSTHSPDIILIASNL